MISMNPTTSSSHPYPVISPGRARLAQPVIRFGANQTQKQQPDPPEPGLLTLFKDWVLAKLEALKTRILDFLKEKTFHWGFPVLSMKLHLSQFPGNYKHILEEAQKNATASNAAGGFQILKKGPDGKFPQGYFFIDGIPTQPEPGYPNEVDGMHLWINSAVADPDLLVAKTVLTSKIPRKDHRIAFQDIVDRMLPEEALVAMQELSQYWRHKDDWEAWEAGDKRGLARSCLGILCHKVAQTPGLLEINPKWVLADAEEKTDYRSSQALDTQDRINDIFASTKAHRQDREYLESIGYIPVTDYFKPFGVPRVKQVIDRLVEEGSIPPDRKDRVVPEPSDSTSNLNVDA